MKKLIIVSSLLLVLGISAYAANSVSTTAKVKIVPAISITETTQLDFGSLVSPATSSGTVAISASSSATRTPINVPVIPSSSVSFSAGKISVTGDTTATYTITIPSTNQTVTCTTPGTCGSNTMTVNAFSSSPSGSGILSGGAQDIYIGATLNVGVNQATGSYSGTYNVSVAYN